MNTRILIISVAGLILVLFGGFIFLASRSSNPAAIRFIDSLPIIGNRPGIDGPTPPPSMTPPPGPGQESIDRKLVQVVAKKILSPALGPDGTTLRYIQKETGHAVETDLDGANEKKLTNLTILGAFDAQWSPLKNRVLLWYHENGVTKKFLQPMATGTPNKFLPPEATATAWSPDGKELAYLIPNGATTNLDIVNQSGLNPRTIYSTPVPDFTLQWPARSQILLVSRASGFAPSLVLRVNPQTRGAATINVHSHGIVALGQPDGTGFLFSQTSSEGALEPLSRFMFGDNSIKLFGSATIAEKCVFSSDNKKLYCGIPLGELPRPLPDLWYRGAISFSDAIVEIDTPTGNATVLTQEEGDFDMISPFLSEDETYLFFQDKKTGALWRLRLKDPAI